MLVLLARESMRIQRNTNMTRNAYVTFFEFTAMLACRKNEKIANKRKQSDLSDLQYISALGGRYWKMELHLFQSLPEEALHPFVQYVVTTQQEPDRFHQPTFHPTCLVSTPDRPWLATFVPGYLSYQSGDTTNVVCIFVNATKCTQLMSVSDIAGDQFTYIQFAMLASGTHTCCLVYQDKELQLTHLFIKRDCLLTEAIFDFIQHSRAR
jgi:hypothetical protein